MVFGTRCSPWTLLGAPMTIGIGRCEALGQQDKLCRGARGGKASQTRHRLAQTVGGAMGVRVYGTAIHSRRRA